MQETQQLLRELNETMLQHHQTYEKFFWTSYMGDSSVDDDMTQAQLSSDAFRANRDLGARVDAALETAVGEERTNLMDWQKFFSCYQTPEALMPLRKQILDLEAQIQKERGERIEGYTDPRTGEFVEASRGKMRMLITTEKDEALRKACHEGVETLSVAQAASLVELVQLRNEFAKALGYEDFYAYRLKIGEGMEKEELFTMFDEIYDRTRHGFDALRTLEIEKPGLREPWNRAYMLAGDSTAKQDPYVQFDDALMRWGRSFAALGISYQGATLQLDLVERKGKYDHDFCHWPVLVHFEDSVRQPGSANFTCNVIPGQVGSGARAYTTLFHEGGHAAHLTNVETCQVCMNHEYAPLSAAWAETHSMFLDTMQESPEWMTRYAKDANGKSYPFSLYEEEVRNTHPSRPLRFMSIMMVADFERQLYEAKELSEEKVIELARTVTAKYSDYATDSHFVLQVPHMYSWESAAYYHCYGLAELSVEQWRTYFYKKYGYIVDNPAIGPAMYEVWQHGARHTFKEFVQMATGEPLSAEAYLASITGSVDDQLQTARDRIAALDTVPEYTGPVELDAIIRMMHGKEMIADNSLGFEAMAATYGAWYGTLLQDKAV